MQQILATILALWAATATAVDLGFDSEADAEDPYLWLEDVEGDRPMAWVQAQNQRSLKELRAIPAYQHIYDQSLAIYDSQERIPWPGLRGSMVYNFWQDEKHPRGILRRSDLTSYKTADPAWETVLDIDEMSRVEGQSWVYKGSECLAPDYRRCMLTLSRGGSDAAQIREFDTEAKAFVDDGFTIPEAKSGVAWKDENTLWIGTDWGAGSLTSSGYPRIIKEWKRGTALADAHTILETGAQDMGLWPFSIQTQDGHFNLITRRESFFSGDIYLGVGERLVRLGLPSDADFKTIFRDQVIFSLRSDWAVGADTYAGGSLLAVDLDVLLAGRTDFAVLFEPSARVALDSVERTRDRVVFTTLDNVKSRMYRLALTEAGAWTRDEVPLPGVGAASIVETSSDDDLFFFSYEGFLTPDTLYVSSDGNSQKIKSLPALFDAAGLAVSQHEATSRDGTKIPYFLVAREDLETAGNAPTLLYAYGGFEVSSTPRYRATNGAAWLERGGVYVVANIRGGGEFGPAWHEAATQERHIHNFEDFIAVAEDLIARNVTSPRHLGIMGGSQGGLLVGGTFVMRPDLFNAVVSQVPLLDMRRYNKLLAGASWMEEYGDPDKPEDWAYIQTWSPYQLLKEDAKYPEAFFWTTTRDDRVHPGHARKMVAKMAGMGHPVLYYENTEGGHGSGSVNTQRAAISALQYAYLWNKLGH